MPITFACEYCTRNMTVPNALAGRRGKCRACGHEMTVPEPGAVPVVSGYDLADPSPEPEPIGAMEAEPIGVVENTFTRVPREPKRAEVWKPRPEPSPRKLTRRQRAELGGVARRVGIGLGVFALVLVAVALLVPKGEMFAGWTLAGLGIAVFLYGYFTTLYIAWTEDSLYAMLFFLFPPFALWYTVTRMDDLWHRLAIMAAGAAVLTLASWFLRAAVSSEKPEEAVDVSGRSGVVVWKGFT